MQAPARIAERKCGLMGRITPETQGLYCLAPAWLPRSSCKRRQCFGDGSWRFVALAPDDLGLSYNGHRLICWPISGPFRGLAAVAGFLTGLLGAIFGSGRTCRADIGAAGAMRGGFDGFLNAVGCGAVQHSSDQLNEAHAGGALTLSKSSPSSRSYRSRSLQSLGRRTVALRRRAMVAIG